MDSLTKTIHLLLVDDHAMFRDSLARTLEKAGAVGDMLGHLMDEDGELIDHPLNRRTVAITLEDLRKLRRVVLVSGGAKKFHVTRAALRDATPQSENAFKIELAKRCLTHALQLATA